MATAAYEFLIQYISDIKGITRAKGELRKLEAYNRKFGKNVGAVSKVLSRNISQSTRQIAGGASQTTRNIERTFRTASGQVYTYSRAVTTSGGKVLKTTGKLQKGFGKTGKAMQGMGRSFSMIAMRALKTIPVWLVLRGVMMGITQAVTGTVKSWIELSNEMGRVAGVTRGTKVDVDGLKDAIINFSRTASKGFKEVASVVYALGSAGLTVTEQMAGFKHIMDVTIGTFGQAEQIAKLVSGAYNVFGKSIEGAYTISAKMQKLSDILAYTYSTQQVELSEIATAMTYVASIGSLLNLSFEQLVGTIGFLNTGMLKGSKSGTALMNAFVKLAVSGDKLAKLGVVFDPSQPLNLLNIMEQLHNIYGAQALSLVSLKEIMDVFGRRGGRAAAQMIDSYDRWRKTLENTHKSFHDFAEEMREKAEDTLPGAFKKLGNSIKANVIDQLKKSEPALKWLAEYFTSINERAADFEKYFKVLPTVPGLITPMMGITGPYHIVSKAGKEIIRQNKTWYDILLDIKKEAEEVAEQSAKIVTFDEEINSWAKKRVDGLMTEEELMAKINKFVSSNLDFEKESLQTATKLVKKIRELIKLRAEEVKHSIRLNTDQKERIKGIKRKGKYELMSAIGVKESVILYTKIGDLISDLNIKIVKANQNEAKLADEGNRSVEFRLKSISIQKIMLQNYKDLEQAQIRVAGEEKNILNIRKLRRDLEIELTKQRQQEANSMRDLAMAYLKADEFEKTRLRRVAELTQMKADELAQAFKEDVYDRRIIDNYLRYFTDEQKIAIGDMAYELSKLPGEIPEIEIKQLLPVDEVVDYWTNWREKGFIAADEWAEYFGKKVAEFAFPGFKPTPGGAETGKYKITKAEIKSTFGEIHITLPEDSLERMAEVTGEMLISRLKTDEALIKTLAKLYSPHLELS